MLLLVAPDVWVDPTKVDCVEFDAFRFNGESKRVMIRFTGGGGKLLPDGALMDDVVHILNETRADEL